METQLLDDAGFQEVKLVPASKGKRFANFLIDYIPVGIFAMVIFIIFDLIGIMSLDSDGLLDRLVGMLLYAVAYILMEGGLKGKTIGKYITKTRTVMTDGSEPDFNTLVKRSFSRIVPFEPFSFLGSADDGWHDRWTDTIVIDEQKSTLPSQDYL
ncbi:MAG: RDD family protein [Saprospiraceae bacterium]|nr:RDD family protein [Lewinella sp.]